MPLHSEIGEPHRRGVGKSVAVRGFKDTRRTRPTESTKQGLNGLTEAEEASEGLYRSAPGPLYICCGCKLHGFVGLLIVGAGVSMTLFLLLDCLILPKHEGFHLVFLYLVLFCLAVISWRPALF